MLPKEPRLRDISTFCAEMPAFDVTVPISPDGLVSRCFPDAHPEGAPQAAVGIEIQSEEPTEAGVRPALGRDPPAVSMENQHSGPQAWGSQDTGCWSVTCPSRVMPTDRGASLPPSPRCSGSHRVPLLVIWGQVASAAWGPHTSVCSSVNSLSGSTWRPFSLSTQDFLKGVPVARSAIGTDPVLGLLGSWQFHTSLVFLFSSELPGSRNIRGCPGAPRD